MPDPIKKSTSYDPSTGETTFKASWAGEGSGISRGPITPKPTQRTVAARQVSSPASRVVATRSESAGQRMAVAFKSPSAAGTVNMEPKSSADASKIIPKDWRDVRKEQVSVKAEMENKKLLQDNPGMKIEDIKRNIQNNKDAAIRKSNRSIKDEGPAAPNKRGSGGCTTC
jgi:hypothetical protein